MSKYSSKIYSPNIKWKPDIVSQVLLALGPSNLARQVDLRGDVGARAVPISCNHLLFAITLNN